MNSYRITQSGQVSIPADVRRRWQTRAVQVEDHGDHVIVRPLPDDPIEALTGIWKGKTRLTTDEARARARREDAEHEKEKLRLYGLDA